MTLRRNKGVDRAKPSPSDHELLRSYARQGQLPAFDALVERYEADLLRLAKALLGDAHEAQDAVQETFVALARRAGDLDRTDDLDAGLAPWCYRVLRNRCIDRLRARMRQATVGLTVEPAMAGEGGVMDLESEDRAVVVWQAVGNLTPLQRAAVVLRYRDDASYQSIATRLGKTVNHVGVLLHQALATLRKDAALRAEVLP